MIDDAPDGAILSIRVIPRAGKTQVAGVRHDSLLVRLAASPVDGMANRQLIDLLARTLGISKTQVEIVAGLNSREKRVKVIGLSAARVRERLGPILE